MRKLATLFGLLMLALSAQAQAPRSNEPIPYIYYYSDIEHAIVIERADGSDSRLIALPEDADLGSSYGGGWSPSGRWFSFQGRVLGLDGRYIHDLDYFPCVEMMLWHPFNDILLVFGSVQRGVPCGSVINTYWLIDPDTNSLLASVTMESYIKEGNPIIYWLEDALMFYEERRDFDRVSYFRVIMHYDGNVQIIPITEEEGGDVFLSEGEDKRGLGNWIEEYNVYPEFEFAYNRLDSLPDLPFDPPRNSSAGSVQAWLWDDKQNWILLGYQPFHLDGGMRIDRVSIYNHTTNRYRELSECGVDFTCIGWLPERVFGMLFG